MKKEGPPVILFYLANQTMFLKEFLQNIVHCYIYSPYQMETVSHTPPFITSNIQRKRIVYMCVSSFALETTKNQVYYPSLLFKVCRHAHIKARFPYFVFSLEAIRQKTLIAFFSRKAI